MKQIFFRRDTWIVATWANKKKSPHRASQTTYHAFLKKLILLKAIAVNLLIQPNEYEVRKFYFFSVRFYQFSERRLKDLRIILAHKKQTSGNSEIRWSDSDHLPCQRWFRQLWCYHVASWRLSHPQWRQGSFLPKPTSNQRLVFEIERCKKEQLVQKPKM